MKKIIFILFTVMTVLILIGCQDSPEKIRHEDVFEALEISFEGDESINNVLNDLELPSAAEFPSNVLVSWESSNPTIITNDGIVTRPVNDTQVILTLSVTIDDKTRTNSFLLIVKGQGVKHQITWIVNDAQDLQIVDDQSILDQPEEPSKEGYYFIGWFNEGVLFDFDTVINKDYTIEAVFEEIQPITYDIEIYEQRIINDTYAKTETITSSGYLGDLINYQTDKQGFHINVERSITSGVLLSAPRLVLKVYYDRDTNDVTYKHGDVVLEQKTFKYGDSIAFIEAPHIDYFQFEGWFLDASFNNEAIEDLVVNQDLTIYAKYIEIKEGPYQLLIYEENIEDDNYSLVRDELLIGLYQSVISYEDIPYGFEINQFMSNAQGTLVIDEPLILEIYFDRIIYEISYQVDETVINTSFYKFGQQLEWIENPTKPYYIFENWFIDYELSDVAPSELIVESNMIFYAKFIEVTSGSYTVNIYRENISDDLYSLYNKFEIIDDFKKTVSFNQAVHGFTLNEELSTIEGWHDFDVELELNLYYNRVLFDVVFVDEVTLYQTQVKYMGLIIEIDDPEKEGYDFMGWISSQNETELYNFSRPVTSNTTLVASWIDLSYPAYEGYYVSLNGLADHQLKNQLTLIISSMKTLSYTSTSNMLNVSDRDPNNSNNVLLVYNRQSVNRTWDGGSTWNKEHVWPQSKLGSASASDIHNLRPSNPSVNSSRGNLAFRDGSGTYGKIDGGWFPGEDDKGDIARIVLYMHVRWGLSITESIIGDLDMFLEWHVEDPVDDFESNRNDILYGYQSNRNPFIDHPELVERIWGSTTLSSGESISLSLPGNSSIMIM